MKKLDIFLFLSVASFCLVAYAFVANVAPGGMGKCNNACSIKFETASGGDAADRGSANGTI